MTKHRIISAFLLLALMGLSFFIYATQKPGSRFAFRYGLDLNGGTELTYRADTSRVEPAEVEGLMAVLRDVIERRVNAFGVSESVTRVEKASVVTGSAEHRLVVELPGVTDTEKAIGIIGATPNLEFKLVREVPGENGSSTIEFVPTGLNGRLLERAQLVFQTAGAAGVGPSEPVVQINFNSEGRELFSKITRENVGGFLAIELDGKVISAPTIREEIPDGTAVITGNFTPEEARSLVRNLNYGALPIPIELASTQVIGATLGEQAKDLGLKAGIWGFVFVALFLLVLYRLPGLTAVLALLMYVAISLSLFKLIPVTLTAAGIAGFIISMGMAIDANVLIFERMKDELRGGKGVSDAVKEGFSRAWLPVRDANLSGIITAIILFWLGNASVKGFALTLGIGSIVSMFTAVTVARTFLFAIAGDSRESRTKRFLFGGKLKQS